MCLFFSLSDRFAVEPTADAARNDAAAAPPAAPDRLAPIPEPAFTPDFSAADRIRAHALGLRI